MVALFRRAGWRVLIGATLIFLLGLSPLQAGAFYNLSWYVVGDGGGASSGGAYQLFGVIGQADAGRHSGGSYVLEGGFLNGAIDASNAAQNWCLYE